MNNNMNSWYQSKLDEQVSIAQELANQRFKTQEEAEREEKTELQFIKEDLKKLNEELEEIKIMVKVLTRAVESLQNEVNKNGNSTNDETGQNDIPSGGNSNTEQSSNDADKGQ